MSNTLENMSKEELLNVIKMFSKNWLTVDGLWFTLVEDKYGMEEALDLDLKMWQRYSSIEAKRIKEIIGTEEGWIKGILKAIQYGVTNPAMPFEYSMDGPNQVYIWYTCCVPQEGRIRSGRGEFPCKPMAMTAYSSFAKMVDPGIKVENVFCPPDSHPPDMWCKWKFTYNKK